MTDIEHAQWIRQFWLDKSDEMKTDLNEAVRIAYQQGRKDALEEVRAEIAEYGAIWVEYKITDKKQAPVSTSGACWGFNGAIPE